MSVSFEKILVAFFIAVLGFGLWLWQPVKTVQIPSENVLIVGLQSGYPPFEFMNGQGQIIGFDIDIAKILAEKLGKQLVIKDMEFEGEILSLKQGKIDLIISGMNITPSRLQEIAMIPYRNDESALSLIFWKEIPEGIHSLEDITKLPHSAVSVESGTIPEQVLNNVKGIEVKAFQGALAPLMDVKYGKSVANLVGQDVAEYLKTKHAEVKLLTIPLPAEEGVMGYGIGVKKGNQELIAQVEAIVKELKASGELKQLENKWFKGGE